jgi:acyl-coenzyme A thioesterase PaaI-like protein
MTYEFDRDTTVTARGDGTFDVDLAPGWVVGGGVHGGYLLAVVGRAIQEVLAETRHGDPFSISAHFVTPSVPGPAYVVTELVRSGGRFSTVRATLFQEADGGAVPRFAAHATFGDLDRAHDATSDAEADALGLALAPPELPPVDECFTWRDVAPEGFEEFAPLLGRFKIWLDPAEATWARGKPSRKGLIQGWFRLEDERPLDPIALLMLVDALPPVTFDLGLFGWAPTLELTAHVRARPAPGLAIVRHRTRTVAGGLFEEDCEVWDSTGRLVAQSRQLALQPRSS